jgi:hypothetical protein
LQDDEHKQQDKEDYLDNKFTVYTNTEKEVREDDGVESKCGDRKRACIILFVFC